jgi:acyl dehydratase
MPLNRDFIGRSYPASAPYDVGREKIREFATAIGDLNPAYVDVEAARALGHPDVIAPPTFLTVLTFRFFDESPTIDPELGLDYSLIVHGEQRFVHHRPVYAGDRLAVTSRVADIRDAGRNELMTTQSEVTTSDGEPVATSYGTLVSRGTAASATAAPGKEG